MEVVVLNLVVWVVNFDFTITRVLARGLIKHVLNLSHRYQDGLTESLLQ